MSELNAKIEHAQDLIRSVEEQTPMLTSSFGIGSAAMLHLAVSVLPKIPVVFIDTGYLFRETLAYQKDLTGILALDVRCFRAEETPEEMERRCGRLWEQDIDEYHRLRKIQPMETALRVLQPGAWISGVRASETKFRETLREREQAQPLRIHPLLHWSNKDVWLYMQRIGLPEHPLAEAGFERVGDWHLSQAGASRFNGKREECGLLNRVARKE